MIITRPLRRAKINIDTAIDFLPTCSGMKLSWLHAVETPTLTQAVSPLILEALRTDRNPLGERHDLDTTLEEMLQAHYKAVKLATIRASDARSFQCHYALQQAGREEIDEDCPEIYEEDVTEMIDERDIQKYVRSVCFK